MVVAAGYVEVDRRRCDLCGACVAVCADVADTGANEESQSSDSPVSRWIWYSKTEPAGPVFSIVNCCEGIGG